MADKMKLVCSVLGIGLFYLAVDMVLFKWQHWAGAVFPFTLLIAGTLWYTNTDRKLARRRDQFIRLRNSGYHMCISCYMDNDKFVVGTHEIEAIILHDFWKSGVRQYYYTDIETSGFVCAEHYEQRLQKWLSQGVDAWTNVL